MIRLNQWSRETSIVASRYLYTPAAITPKIKPCAAAWVTRCPIMTMIETQVFCQG